MQMDDARRQREAWQQRGGESCPHDELDKEYYLGSDTGDKVCKACGETFGPNELKQMGR